MTVQSLLSAGYAEVCRARTNRDKNLRIALFEGTYLLLSGMICLYAISALCISTTVFTVQRCARLVIVVVAPFLVAATWADARYIHDQDPVAAPPGHKISAARCLPTASGYVNERHDTTLPTEETEQ